MKQQKYIIGSIWESNKGYKCSIVKKLPFGYLEVEFIKSKSRKKVYCSNLKRGEFTDNTKYVYEGVFDTYPEYHGHKFYIVWKSMLERCYNTKALINRPSYAGCSVCKEWLVFSKFKDWLLLNYKEGQHLDKDVKVKGNRIYSPETCIFLPQELNSITCVSRAIRGELPLGVTRCDSTLNPFKASIKYTENGVVIRKHLGCFSTKESAFMCYRDFKLEIIREKVDNYFSEGAICEDVRDILLRYDINISD